MTGLSGGQAARVGLASLLLSRYDVLLLDEPTNDLDLAGLDQLERFVAGSRAGIVVVSHDREFLARTVTRVVELDLAQQLVRVHDGGYEAYLVEREVARRHAREEYEEFADTKAGLEARARMQRNWMAKGVRDSIKKSKDGDKHIKAAQPGVVGEAGAPRPSRPSGGSSGWRSSRSPARSGSCGWRSPPHPGPAPSSPPCAAPSSGAGTSGSARWTCRSTGATGVAITGANGSGQVDPAGRAARPGAARRGDGVARARRCGSARSTRPAGCFFGPEQLLDAFGAEVPDWPTAEVRTLLAKFGLTADHVLRPAETLSPGERTRAGAGAPAGARGQRAGARRADQPPRPAGDRAARAGAGRLRGHAAARHPRPPDARRGAHDRAAATVSGGRVAEG